MKKKLNCVRMISLNLTLSTIDTCRSGGMADAADSKSAEGNFMRVRLPPSAPQALRLAIYLKLNCKREKIKVSLFFSKPIELLKNL